MDAVPWECCSSRCRRASAPHEGVIADKEEATTETTDDSSKTENPTVVYNVGGHRFEVLRETIKNGSKEKEPTLTLLEEELQKYEKYEETGEITGEIFIDANPDRFQYILDWYRHGEIHTPVGFPRKAIIKDVEFFGLPKHKVNLNGSLLAARAKAPDGTGSTKAEVNWEHTLEADLHEELDRCVLKNWPAMDEYVQGIIRDMKDKLELDARKEDVHVSKIPFSVILTKTKEDGTTAEWKDRNNVCSQGRLNMVLSEFKKRGFACQLGFPGSGRVVLELGLAGTVFDTDTVSI